MSKGTILVTGGTGYIGTHTIVDLHQHGYEPVSIDNGVNSNESMIKNVESLLGATIPHYSLDICDLESIRAVFQKHNIEGVIHFAALKAVGQSTEQPIRYFKNNIESLMNIMECMREFDVKNLIYSSSCTVYGNATTNPVNEDTPWQEAESPYGRTKQIGEQIIQDTFKYLKGKAVLLRYFNPAGAHPSGHIGESPIVKALNLVPAITETAIGKRDSMTVFGTDYDTRDGSCVRDFIHVVDLARAHTLALDSLVNQDHKSNVEVYNLGMGEGVTVLEAIKAFEKVSGQSLNYQLGGRRPGDVVAIYADSSKARKVLGWKPKYGIEEIMSTAWAWENKNR